MPFTARKIYCPSLVKVVFFANFFYSKLFSSQNFSLPKLILTKFFSTKIPFSVRNIRIYVQFFHENRILKPSINGFVGCTPDTCTWFTNRFVIIKVDLKHLSRSDWFYCKMTRNKWRYIIFVCHFDPKTLLWKKRRHNVLHIGAPIVCVQPLEYLFDIGSFTMLVWLVCIWMYVHQTLQSKVEVETQFSMLNPKKTPLTLTNIGIAYTNYYLFKIHS